MYDVAHYYILLLNYVLIVIEIFVIDRAFAFIMFMVGRLWPNLQPNKVVKNAYKNMVITTQIYGIIWSNWCQDNMNLVAYCIGCLKQHFKSDD